MFLDSVLELFVPMLVVSALAFATLVGLAAFILRLLARQRALEIRMAERIALVRRGLHPITFEPLPAGAQPASGEPTAS